MNCIKVTNEDIPPNKKALLFTILFDGVKYGVVRLDETCICARITWNPWSGFRYSDVEVSDDVIALCGYYNNTTRTITIDIDHLGNGETEDILETLLHEVRHHIQHRMVDFYCSVGPHIQEEHRNMSPFKETAVFLDNFNDYHDSDDGYEMYYSQVVEEDSRDWAIAKMRWYDSFIDGSR